MIYLEELECIGLTKREIKVYLSLLKVGLSSVGKIIDESDVPSSKIYEILNKLKQKGFVSSVFRDNKMFFEASDPETIVDFLEDQKTSIVKNVVPKLEALQKTNKEKTEATVYEGLKGLKHIYEKMLRSMGENDTIYAMGIPLKAQELMGPFIENFNLRRVQRKINLKIIYHNEARRYGEKRKKMPFSNVKYLKENIVTPTWFDLFGDNLVIFDVVDDPRAVLIKNKNIVNSFKQYFETIWKTL